MRPKRFLRVGLLCGTLAALLPGAARCEPLLRDVIDARVGEAWQREKIQPSGPAGDGEFLRRVYLDLTGTIPDYETAASFLDDGDRQKREKLIDRLLDSPQFARQQTDFWDMLLFGRDPADSRARKRDGFLRWMRQQFAENKPLDEIFRQMLLARGNTVEQGAPMYLMQYVGKPEDATVALSQILLGVQLQCARCHDHPYESWTQLDFYGMASFLSRLELVGLGKKEGESAYAIGEKSTGDLLFTGPAAEQEPGKKGEPVGPKFLLASAELQEPELPEDFEEPRRFPSGKMPPEPRFSRKDKLAEWVTGADNPFFARAMVNRTWAQYLGRGLVHPVDNMSPSNGPSHPELLATMTEQFVAHKFDLKWLVREICNSQVYQLSSSGPVEEAMPRWFQRARVRPLSAEELAQAWRVATRFLEAKQAAGEKIREDDRFYGLTSGYMLNFFGQPTDGVGNFQGGLHEHLYLTNGQLWQLITQGEGGLHHAISNSEAPWPARVERLFVSVLSRRPSPEERDELVRFITAAERTDERLKEAIWALMTCSEFRFNH